MERKGQGRALLGLSRRPRGQEAGFAISLQNYRNLIACTHRRAGSWGGGGGDQATGGLGHAFGSLSLLSCMSLQKKKVGTGAAVVSLCITMPAHEI